ncbi:class I SAM-dependent methyltransferase [Mycolicibacterium litorale]|uniref:O-methyltransferase Omt n=1 Tax=Mycolicibacterium litorale TaxID=758802 RepID=A0AAD1MR74_9MYCO|nr:class I SAM-dependent methyltransferase [Mycolicibacterium litorale]MCV7414749.1 class I SAM-dependent methyltransferase [Mycolicibacterium litorale]TDY07994.1 O-methyltransferase involved in polyketide biosynthesis [Mycolicibacterium litorale]BBY15914.1 putative O-methyltransferase Omt [Mycolicibacterium litorale]
MDAGALSPVQQTALATAYARALDSRSPRSILGDTLADEVVAGIDFDFAGLGVTPSVVCLVALRARMLDDMIRRFVTEQPDAVVVDLGAGLSTGVFRVDPPPSVDWFSVDLPEMTALRDGVLPHRYRSHSLAASVAETDWLRVMPADRPAIVVADGLFPFLPDAVVAATAGRITEHFRLGMIAFNDYGTVSRLNRLAKLIMARKPMFRTMYGQWEFRGFRDAHHPETWGARMRLVEESSAMRQPEVALFPPLLRIGSRLGARVPAVASKARVLCYRFDPPDGTR